MDKLIRAKVEGWVAENIRLWIERCRSDDEISNYTGTDCEFKLDLLGLDHRCLIDLHLFIRGHDLDVVNADESRFLGLQKIKYPRVGVMCDVLTDIFQTLYIDSDWISTVRGLSKFIGSKLESRVIQRVSDVIDRIRDDIKACHDTGADSELEFDGLDDRGRRLILVELLELTCDHNVIDAEEVDVSRFYNSEGLRDSIVSHVKLIG